ncbi:MAG: ferrous iron transport protein A [Clostridiaceae bacterium]|nr:ferrous iron transport protein A [Clostridiaceae bacterium]
MVPLTCIKPGEECKILRVVGKDNLRSHLKDMGFVPGSSIQLICANCDNVICKLKNTRIAIDQDIARKIMV